MALKKILNFKIRNTFTIVISFIVSFFILDLGVNSFLRKGLKKYYGIEDNSEIALIGHSHIMLGLDKESMEKELNIKVAKYTSEGVDILNRKVMIDYLLEKNDSIKLLIYGVDAWSFSGEGLSANSQVLFYPFLDNVNIDHYLRECVPFKDYLTRKIIKTTRYNEGLISSSFRGYLQNWDNMKSGTVNLKKVKEQIAKNKYRKINNNPLYIETLTQTIETLSLKKIKIILFYIPTLHLINEVENKKFKKNINIFEQIESDYDNVKFINFTDAYSHRYELFYDPIHLNSVGQKLVTDSLIKILQKNYYNDIGI